MVKGGEFNEVSETSAYAVSAPQRSVSFDGPTASSSWRPSASHWFQDVRCSDPYIGDGRLAFPCGQCDACRINRARIWSHRIILEGLSHVGNSFVTLTYREEPAGNSLNPKHVQNWLKRLRFSLEPRLVRYFVVGEYGDRGGRPHYHAALFGLDACCGGPIAVIGRERTCQCATCVLVRDSWGYGHTMCGTLEPASASYIAGYVTKKMLKKGDPDLRGRYPEFARMSLRPGIGAGVIPDVASVLMRWKLEQRMPDVPLTLRHGSRELPLGRYLRKRLRVAVGLPEAAPEAYIEALRAGLLPVFDAATALTSAPGMAKFRRALVGQMISDANRQTGRNMKARQSFGKRRTL